MIFMIK